MTEEHPGFQPVDEPLELPPRQPDPPRRSSMQSGMPTPNAPLPKTHRMLLGMLHAGLKERGLSQAELAQLSGLSRPFISQLLSGRRIGTLLTWDTLLDIVHFDYHGLATFKPEATGASYGQKRRTKTVRPR